MPQATQIRLTQLTGSFGTAAGQITDQGPAVATGSQNVTGLDGVLSTVASAIKRIHGFDSFTQALPGVFGQNTVVSGSVTVKDTAGLSTVSLSTLGVISGSGNLQVGGKATVNGNVETTGSLVLKQVAAAPTGESGASFIYQRAGTLYFKTDLGSETAFGSSTAPGADTQVIFNDGGSNFGADSGFTYNKTTDTLTIAGGNQVGGVLGVTGSASFLGGVTLGDASGDTVTVNGTTTFVGSGVTTTFAGDVAVNGGDITSTAGTFNLLAAPTTINIGNTGATVNIGQSGTGNVLNVRGNATIAGNLYVQGTTTEVSSTVVVINDRVIQLGTGSTTAADTFERGISFLYGDGGAIQNGFMGYERASGFFTFADQSTEPTTDNFTITRTAPLSASNGRLGLLDVGGSGAGSSNATITTVGSNALTLQAANNNITNVANVFVVSGTSGGTPSLRFVDGNIQLRDTNQSGQSLTYTDTLGATSFAKVETSAGATPNLVVSGANNVDLLAGGTVRFNTLYNASALPLISAGVELTTFTNAFGAASSIINAIGSLRQFKHYRKVDATQNGGTIMSASLLLAGDGARSFGTSWTATNSTTRNDKVDVFYNGQLLLSSSYDGTNYDYAVAGASGDVTFNFTMSTDDIVLAVTQG